MVSQAFASTNALTYIRPNDSGKKVPIYDDEDLEKFAGGRDLTNFDAGALLGVPWDSLGLLQGQILSATPK